MVDVDDDMAILVDSFHTHSVGFWLSNKMANDDDIDDCDVVIPSALYELGMRTMNELKKRIIKTAYNNNNRYLLLYPPPC